MMLFGEIASAYSGSVNGLVTTLIRGLEDGSLSSFRNSSANVGICDGSTLRSFAKFIVHEHPFRNTLYKIGASNILKTSL
jgi:hypothetical protein